LRGETKQLYRGIERGVAVGTPSAFYDLFVGTGSFAAGGVASHFGYAATFVMAACALIASALVGWYVLPAEEGPMAGPAMSCEV
jgi:predicted MFS family arabinose efflux permease